MQWNKSELFDSFSLYSNISQNTSPFNNSFLSFSTIKSRRGQICKNHKRRGGNYYVETHEGENIYFCQKCSVLAASQGFTIKKLEDNSYLFQKRILEWDRLQKVQKQKKLKKLIQTIDQMSFDFLNFKNIFIDKIQDQFQKECSNTLIQQIQSKINAIKEAYQLQKYQLRIKLKHLKQSRQSMISQFQAKLKYIMRQICNSIDTTDSVLSDKKISSIEKALENNYYKYTVFKKHQFQLQKQLKKSFLNIDSRYFQYLEKIRELLMVSILNYGQFTKQRQIVGFNN